MTGHKPNYKFYRKENKEIKYYTDIQKVYRCKYNIYINLYIQKKSYWTFKQTK